MDFKFILLITLTLNVINISSIAQEVNFPGGNIALLHDGNFRDPDDIGALPFNLAMLDAADLKDKLVYLEHSHFLGCNDAGMEAEMIESTREARERFGPFPNADFYNYYRQSEEARSALIASMNAASSDAPLWIICAGRMESLYRALKGSDPKKRKNLILVSHSVFNEDYTRNRSGKDRACTEMLHTWKDIKDEFGDDGIYFIESSHRTIVKDDPHKLVDQNHSNDVYDFQSEEQYWEWLKDLGEDYAWLLSRNRVEQAFDVSDSGMLWFVISGGVDRQQRMKKGCETCGWREMKVLFEEKE